MFCFAVMVKSLIVFSTMKSFPILSIAFLFLFSSCKSYLPYAASELDVPLRAGKKVEVFYAGELLPYKDYVTVGSITLREGLNRNETLYIDRLKKIALKSGIDAIINVKRYFDPDAYIDEASYLYTGTGIKYIQNLDYLDEYVWKESLYKPDTSTKQDILIGMIERTPDGQILSSKFLDDKASSSYKLYIQEFRDYHLVEEKRNWTYRLDPTNQYPVSRQYIRPGHWKVKTCKYRYKNQFLSQIYVDYHEREDDTTINYYYDHEGRVASRQLTLTHNREILENYHYDDANRLIKKDYIIRSAQVGFHLAYSSKYEYYKKEDIHEFIE
ncbi:hypothetical protein AB832_06765 [Flavobacteriaceae bacterium (ex Bugula neritina AB1)]|nr:hypothetical protein AB832_06765 [Flavobacteriaceae bacterium (ex Bugula neritina AB1)]